MAIGTKTYNWNNNPVTQYDQIADEIRSQYPKQCEAFSKALPPVANEVEKWPIQPTKDGPDLRPRHVEPTSRHGIVQPEYQDGKRSAEILLKNIYEKLDQANLSRDIPPESKLEKIVKAIILFLDAKTVLTGSAVQNTPTIFRYAFDDLAANKFCSCDWFIGSKKEVRHSPDFRSVHWFGTDYSFTGMQSDVVEILWEAWENGTPEVGDAYILETISSDCGKINHLFKGQPAYGSMIQSGSTRGTHKLVEPAKIT